MTNQVYMYTSYPDLDSKTLGLEVAQIFQSTRDQTHIKWMVSHGIQPYPKSVLAHQKDRPLFEMRSRENPETIFLFPVKINGKEISCMVLYQNQWRLYNTIEHAQRDLLQIPNNHTIQFHTTKACQNL